MSVVSAQRRANPYLQGNHAPVTREVDVRQLRVIGRIPPELRGRFVRNGPNALQPVDSRRHHEFIGEGMVHGVRLTDGRAEWYRNRWVRGASVREHFGEPDCGGPVHLYDFSANTHVIGFAGRTLALVEAGSLPVELDFELNSVSRHNFHGTLPNGFTAHVKVDPNSGERHALAYAWEVLDHIQHIVLGPDGQVRTCTPIRLAGPSMVHDVGITARHVVVLDQPVLLDPLLVAARRPVPFSWREGYGSRVGLLSRSDPSAPVHWFEVEESFAFHILNAYEIGEDRVEIDVARYPRTMDKDRHGSLGDGLARLQRWSLNLYSGRATETVIDERHQDFGRINDAYTGKPYRYGYLALFGEGRSLGNLVKQDLATGVGIVHDLGTSSHASEPVFVPHPKAAEEDQGWVLCFVYDNIRQASALWIIDAGDFAARPVAIIELPVRIPTGFHGSWISDAEVPPPP